MKFKIDIDCTPQEARTFLGLPDVESVQKALYSEIETRHARGARPHGSRAHARDLDAGGQGLGGPDEGVRAQGRSRGEAGSGRSLTPLDDRERGGTDALSDQS